MVDGWCLLFSIFFIIFEFLDTMWSIFLGLVSVFLSHSVILKDRPIRHSAMKEKRKKVVVGGTGILGNIHVPGGGGVFVNSVSGEYWAKYEG